MTAAMCCHFLLVIYQVRQSHAEKTRGYLHMQWVSLQERNPEITEPKFFFIMVVRMPALCSGRIHCLWTKFAVSTSILEKNSLEQSLMSTSAPRCTETWKTHRELPPITTERSEKYLGEKKYNYHLFWWLKRKVFEFNNASAIS